MVLVGCPASIRSGREYKRLLKLTNQDSCPGRWIEYFVSSISVSRDTVEIFRIPWLQYHRRIITRGIWDIRSHVGEIDSRPALGLLKWLSLSDENSSSPASLYREIRSRYSGFCDFNTILESLRGGFGIFGPKLEKSTPDQHKQGRNWGLLCGFFSSVRAQNNRSEV